MGLLQICSMHKYPSSAVSLDWDFYGLGFFWVGIFLDWVFFTAFSALSSSAGSVPAGAWLSVGAQV